MRLVINTASSPAYVALVGKSGPAVQLLSAAEKPEQSLLPAIEQMLKQRGMDLVDLKGIVVAVQAGTFSGVRAGVVTANALQYALGIPLGTFIPEATVLPLDQVQNLDRVPLSPEPVIAEYTGQPNITQPKK